MVVMVAVFDFECILFFIDEVKECYLIFWVDDF